MTARRQGQTPEAWGDDALTTFLDTYRSNQFATFVGRHDEVSDLIAIDEMIRKLVQGARDPKPFVPMTFLLRAHSAYRSAAGAVMAGQLYEAQALLRLCLEHSAYGHYIGGDNAMWERWMRRHDSVTHRDAVRKEFTAAKIKKKLQSSDGGVSNVYELLYEQVIDFGSHPNERGFSMSSMIRHSHGDVYIDAIYLHQDGLPLRSALRTTAQVGIFVLRIAQIIYPNRLADLGIDSELQSIMQRY